MEYTEQQEKQAAEYRLPYHYFATFDPLQNTFSSFRRLSFAVYYAVTAKIVFDCLKERRSETWLDVGCGDGALISGLDRFLPDVLKSGIDYDPRSIELARLINPSWNFSVADITAQSLEPANAYDVVTLIEVFEHIPPTEGQAFLKALGSKVNKGGYILITVPHINQRMPAKHYRHFTTETLKAEILDALPDFAIESIHGFGEKNLWERVVKGLFNTKAVYLELPVLNKLRLKAQLKALPVREERCQQLIAILKKDSSC